MLNLGYLSWVGKFILYFRGIFLGSVGLFFYFGGISIVSVSFMFTLDVHVAERAVE